jgi:hypothetical protein
LVYGLGKWKHKSITYGLLGICMCINIYGLNVHYSFNFKNDDYRQLIGQISRDQKAGDRIYVEPHYNGWVIDYYKKQDNLNIPNTVFIRYGWNEILDSISVQKPERFWVVMDYSAVDTTKYKNYLTDLNSRYTLDFKMTYYLAPSKVELYRFK